MTSELIARLRADLAAAHYSVTALTGLWGIEADAALHRNQPVPALRALAALRRKLGRPTASATLAELFVLGRPVSAADVAEALPSLGLDGAQELRLIAANGNANGSANGSEAAEPTVRPLLDLRPYSFLDSQGAGSWWIASDLGELALGHPLGESHVLGVGGASVTLSGLIIPQPVESALDLGTGCGIQALHAARIANRVVATDISERALELAALNAELNGIRNIEFRLGSLYEPVAGERFDRIVSNPPFVITPRTEGVPSYEYRDGGMVGDALVEAVMTGAAAHLTEGGIAQLLGNWEYRTDADAFDRIRAWLDAAPAGGAGDVDAWIIEREVQLPAQYAETWIRDGGTRPGTPDFDRLYNAWLDDFEARGVSQVGFGYVLLRRPVGGNGADAAPRPDTPADAVDGEKAHRGQREESAGRRGPAEDPAAQRADASNTAAQQSDAPNTPDNAPNTPNTPDNPAHAPNTAAQQSDAPNSPGNRADAPGTPSTPGTPERIARLLRLERLHGSLGTNDSGLGTHLAACLAAHDWQAATDDTSLTHAVLTVASDVTEERHYWPGAEDPTLMLLHQGGGFGRSVPLDTALAALIGACDGDLPIGAIIAALAQLLEASFDDLSADLLPRVRELLDDGFLEPPTS